MRCTSIIRGSEAPCYCFPTSLPTRIKSAQEVLTSLPCREAAQPHIQGEESGASSQISTCARHRDLNIWDVSDLCLVRCYCVLGKPKTWENLTPAPNQDSHSAVHGLCSFAGRREEAAELELQGQSSSAPYSEGLQS